MTSGRRCFLAASRLFPSLELLGAVVPVVDLLGEPSFDGGPRLVDLQVSRLPHFLQVPRGGLLHGPLHQPGLQSVVDPCALGGVQNGGGVWFGAGQRAVVEVGRAVQVPDAARRLHLHVKHLLGHDPAVAALRRAAILHGVFQVEEHPRLAAGVPVVHQNGPTLQQLTVALQRQVQHRVQQGVTRAHERCRGLADRRLRLLVEDDALVAGQYRLPSARQPVPSPHDGRHVRNLITAGLPLSHLAAQPTKRLHEERLHVVRLQPAGVGALHLLAHPVQLAGVDRAVGQGLVLHKVAELVPIHRVLHGPVETSPYVRPLTVADRLRQQVAQRPAFEVKLAQHVEHLAAQRLPRLFQLLEKPAVHVALAGFGGHKVPEVAHLALADSVDAPEALLDPVGVPGQVVVHHQVRALKVDPFPCRVGGQENLRLGVVAERLLGLQPLLAPHAPMDDDQAAGPSQQRPDARLQVVQRVPVLREDHQLLRGRRRVRRDFARAVGELGGLHDAPAQAGRREDLAKHVGQLLPLGVVAAP